MQIMPENALVRTAAGSASAANLYAELAGDQFGLEISNLLQRGLREDAQNDSASLSETREDDEDEEERTVASPYNPVPELVSPFAPQEARLPRQKWTASSKRCARTAFPPTC